MDGNKLLKIIHHAYINSFFLTKLDKKSCYATKRFLSFMGIKPAIRVRKNAGWRSENHQLRNRTVLEQKINLQQWKKVDCRICLFMYEKDVWIICYCNLI